MPLRNGGLKVKRLRQLDRKSKPKIVVAAGGCGGRSGSSMKFRKNQLKTTLNNCERGLVRRNKDQKQR